MKWNVLLCPEFEAEFDTFSEEVQDELLACTGLLQAFGSTLGRPHVDTLKNSKYTNMKELRFKVNGGVWRVAFAFDPNREAILLVAANKAGKSEQLFYRQLIQKADKRFTTHLLSLENEYGKVH